MLFDKGRSQGRRWGRLFNDGWWKRERERGGLEDSRNGATFVEWLYGVQK